MTSRSPIHSNISGAPWRRRRRAGALFADISLDGQVDLLTTGAFDSPAELLQMDRTRSVAFFSVGSNVGDARGLGGAGRHEPGRPRFLDPVAGRLRRSRARRHRTYQAGMSYSLQRYQGGNTAALAALPDTASNVGSVFAYDEWALSSRVSVGYGANFAYYDYLVEPSLLSPRSRRATWYAGLAHPRPRHPAVDRSRRAGVPARRLERRGCRPSARSRHCRGKGSARRVSNTTKGGVERLLNGATIGVRAFRQQDR